VEQLARYVELMNRDPQLAPVGGSWLLRPSGHKRARWLWTAVFAAWWWTTTLFGAWIQLTPGSSSLMRGQFKIRVQ
jgi:hypothetical protein